MRYTHSQLRDFLDAQLTLLTGTVDPTDEQVLEIYAELQRKLYPTRPEHESVRDRVDREQVKKLRRAIEQVYPWVREDAEVRGIATERKPVKDVVVIPERDNAEKGVIILHDSRVSGQSDTIRYERLVPDFAQRAGRFDVERPLPLFVLLSQLLHFEKVLSPDTPVRVLRADAGLRPSRAQALRLDSAMPLSAFLDSL